MHPNLSCEIPEVFMHETYKLPFKFMGYTGIVMRRSTVHAMFTAIFASLVCPFVGFFVNGVKRAFRIEVRQDVNNKELWQYIWTLWRFDR